MNRPAVPVLDFVARRRIASRGGWLLLAAGCVLAVAAVPDWQNAREETGRWQAKAAEWASAARRADHGGVAAVDSASLRPQLEGAAAALAQLAVPWGALYGALEDSADDSVSLLVVLPNADKGEVQLNGEAKDFAALRRYLERLNGSGALAEARLLGQEVRQGDAQKPIFFRIAAVWRLKP